MFGHIVPCGIVDKPVTSLRAEGVAVPMREVVDAIAARAAARWGGGPRHRAPGSGLAGATRRTCRRSPAERGPARRGGGTARSGCSAAWPRPASTPARGLSLAARKPEWLRVKADMGAGYRALKRTMRSLDLVTVCEEAGCPNIFECWADGTATFMINGDRCTRACGFCLVDTRKPAPADPGEPERVAEAQPMRTKSSLWAAIQASRFRCAFEP